MSSRILFIVNPKSNAARTKKNWEKVILPEILKIFPAAYWSFTQKSSEASLLAHFAKKQAFDIVVAVGGDGTINEVVNGLLDNPLFEDKNFSPKIFNALSGTHEFHVNSAPLATHVTPQLAFLPAGTGCDFIKTLKIPLDIPSALKVIANKKYILSDVGLIKYTSSK